jgi:tetratricopeptide (TPR) repeat protein
MLLPCAAALLTLAVVAGGAAPDPLEARINEGIDRLVALDGERVQREHVERASDNAPTWDVRLCVDPSAGRVDAVCRIELGAGDSRLGLALASDFEVTSLTSSSGETLRYERGGRRLSVDVPGGGQGAADVAVTYGRTLNRGTGEWLPDRLIVLGADSPWCPVPESGDPVALTVEVHYPSGYSSVMSGTLAGMASTDSVGPCTNGDLWSIPSYVEAPLLAVGAFDSKLKVSGDVFLSYHRLVGAAGDSIGATGGPLTAEVPAELPELLRFLERCYGPYPFEWLNVIAVPSATAMTEPVVGGPGLVIVPVPEAGGPAEVSAILVHRLVGPVSDCWWRFRVKPCTFVSEGLSSKAEADWLEATGRGDAAERLRSAYRAQFMRYLTETGGASLMECVGPDPPGDPRLCGGKGAAALELLNQQIGEEAYCDALRSLASVRGGDAVSIEATMDAFERSYGETLDWFFYEWVVREDLPTYVLDYDSRRDHGGTYVVEGTISQHGEFFRTPVPLTIDLGGWSYEETIPIASSVQSFELRTDAEPLQIVVDGNGTIPKIGASERALAHHDRGTRAAGSGNWEVAADELGAAALLEPSKALYVYDYGQALVRLGRVREGSDQLERAAELAPDRADYRLAIASLDLAGSDYASALDHLDAFVRLRPRDRSGHVSRAVALLGLGRLDEAEAGLALAEGLTGGADGRAEEADLLVARGMLHEARGEFRAAVRSYEAALACYPVSDEARRRLRAITESNRWETE